MLRLFAMLLMLIVLIVLLMLLMLIVLICLLSLFLCCVSRICERNFLIGEARLIHADRLGRQAADLLRCQKLQAALCRLRGDHRCPGLTYTGMLYLLLLVMLPGTAAGKHSADGPRRSGLPEMCCRKDPPGRLLRGTADLLRFFLHCFSHFFLIHDKIPPYDSSTLFQWFFFRSVLSIPGNAKQNLNKKKSFSKHFS